MTDLGPTAPARRSARTRLSVEFGTVFGVAFALATIVHFVGRLSAWLSFSGLAPSLRTGVEICVLTLLFVGVAVAAGRLRDESLGALQESEERYRSLVETSPDAITVTDLNTRIVFCNGQALAMHGYDRLDEVIGRSALDFVAPEDRDRAIANARRTLETGNLRNIAYTLLRKDGSRFPAELSASVIRGADGQPATFIGVVRDVTWRRRSEEALRESEARKAAILNTALDAIITIDQQGRVLEFNPAAERMFGYTREEVLGHQMAEMIVPPALREAQYRGLAQYLATGQGPALGTRMEMSAMRSDATEFPVELAITSIPIDGTVMFTGYVRDITERKRAERIQEFLAEIGTVLSSSLDFETTLQTLARMVVLLLADWCDVYVVEDGGVARCVAVVPADAAKDGLARELLRYHLLETESAVGVPGRCALASLS